MKTRFLLLILSVLMAGALSAQNLFTNGDFEAAGTGDFYKSAWGGAAITMSKTDVAYAGDSALSLDVTAGLQTNGWKGRLNLDSVILASGKTYVASFMARTATMEDDSMIVSYRIVDQKNWVSQFQVNDVALVDTNWQEFTQVVTVNTPQAILDTTKWDFHIGLAKSEVGMIYVDNIVLREAKPVTGITASPEKLDLTTDGEDGVITVEFTPADADNKAVSWSSKYDTIATVNAGKVKAVGPGETWIYATSDDSGFQDSVMVTVTGDVVAPPASGITWSSTALTAETDVITEGTLVEAATFASGLEASASDWTTTVNGVDFEAAMSGLEGDWSASNTWENPSTDHLSTTSNRIVPTNVDQYRTDAADASSHFVGLAAFDKLLSRFLWSTNALDTITLSGLEVGGSYKLQLFMGDTRENEADSYILINPNAALTDAEYGGADVTKYGNSNGLSMVGEFTATETSIKFALAKVKDGTGGFNLNAFQLRKITAASLRSAVDNGFSIYPNPTNSVLTISETVGHATIYSLNGTLVKTVMNTNTVDVSELNAGMYILRSNNKFVKFVKE